MHSLKKVYLEQKKEVFATLKCSQILTKLCEVLQ